MGEAPAVGGGTVPEAPAALALEADLSLPYKDARAQVVDAFEARYLEALLARANGNVSAAARLARMTRSHLNDLIAKRRG